MDSIDASRYRYTVLMVDQEGRVLGRLDSSTVLPSLPVEGDHVMHLDKPMQVLSRTWEFSNVGAIVTIKLF